MTRRNDISTPEGYFEALLQRLQRIPDGTRTQAVPWTRRLAPYAAIAASMLLAVTVGNFILRKTAAMPEDDADWDYVTYLAQAMDPDGIVDLDETLFLSDEDIVNYLVDEGISVEQVNYISHEEGY
ncbi:MAG: hypothetical protein IJ721_06785 [Bacteroidales bacterium]|nr:hypothetical protein [Bacteroidales bacterium]